MKFETPLNMIIVGVTGCGKTYYLLKMLENDYKGHFEYIFLICGTKRIRGGNTKTIKISSQFPAIKTR